MARKKKEKIIVKLDLPKDDTTLTKLYAILGVSIFLGLASFTFWVTNSHFTTAPNGQPLFVNMACGYDPNYIPTFDDNESCQFGLLKDEPDVLVMTPEDPWKEFKGLGQLFDVPGMDMNRETYRRFCRSHSSLFGVSLFRLVLVHACVFWLILMVPRQRPELGVD